MGNPDVDTLPGVTGKALEGPANERLREVVRALVEQDFDGNRAGAARRLGVSQSYVQEFLAGTRGAGRKLLEGLADYTGRSIDDLMGRRTKKPGAATLGQHPDWPAKEAEARKRYGRAIEGRYFDKAARTSGTELPEVLTVEFVRRMAEAWQQAELDQDPSESSDDRDGVRPRG
jgi:transcriptional regulator with XRE-family HTH domain